MVSLKDFITANNPPAETLDVALVSNLAGALPLSSTVFILFTSNPEAAALTIFLPANAPPTTLAPFQAVFAILPIPLIPLPIPPTNLPVAIAVPSHFIAGTILSKCLNGPNLDKVAASIPPIQSNLSFKNPHIPLDLVFVGVMISLTVAFLLLSLSSQLLSTSPSPSLSPNFFSFGF